MTIQDLVVSGISGPNLSAGTLSGGGISGPVDPTEIRNLINFRAVMQSYVSIPEVTATGDFEYAFSIYIPDAADNSVLISRSTEESRTVAVRSDGGLRFHFGTTFRDTSGIDVRNSRVYDIVVSRTGTRAVVTANGVTVLDQTSPSIAGDYIMGAIMRRDGAQQSNYVSGFMFNFRCVSGFDSNPTYPLDDTLINSNVIRNSAATLGSELVTNGDFNSPAGWSLDSGWTITGGELVVSGPVNFSGASTSLSLTAGDTYVVEFEITEYTSGTIRAEFNGGTEIAGEERSSVGTFSETFTAVSGNNTLRLECRASSFNGRIGRVSVREAPGYGTAFGLGAGDSEPYTDLPAEFVQVANTALISSTDVLGDNANPEFSPNVLAVATGNRYRISATISTVNGTPTNNAGWSSAGGVPATAPFRLTGTALAVGAVIGGDFDAINNDSIRLFGRSNAQIALSSIETRRVLRKAS